MSLVNYSSITGLLIPFSAASFKLQIVPSDWQCLLCHVSCFDVYEGWFWGFHSRGPNGEPHPHWCDRDKLKIFVFLFWFLFCLVLLLILFVLLCFILLFSSWLLKGSIRFPYFKCPSFKRNCEKFKETRKSGPYRWKNAINRKCLWGSPDVGPTGWRL